METPIELPPNPAQRELEWVAESAVSGSTSPFTLSSQYVAWPGQRRRCILKMPPMKIEDAQTWQAFFEDLNGMEGTFYLSDAAFARVSELDLGTPELDGNHASSPYIKTRAWNPNRQLFRKGQFCEIAGRLRRVLSDVWSDADGKAVFKVWPYCRDLPSTQPVYWQNPRGVFRLQEMPTIGYDRNRLGAGFQFAAVEAVLA